MADNKSSIYWECYFTATFQKIVTRENILQNEIAAIIADIEREYR